MKTLINKIDPNNIDISTLSNHAEIIKSGGLVAFPTETVYGLGASALNPTAISNIFKVKNRPSNNPLIAHISNCDMLETLVQDMPIEINKLISTFWPGALTIVLNKRKSVPDIVTANGPTVAVRCPSHPIANELISLSGVPIVAPSANLSGKPSPTCFSHVYDDLNESVEGIIDGGNCDIGIESTVVIPIGTASLKILRPGAITPDMLSNIGFDILVDKNVLNPVSESSKVASPGMLYKHYAPVAKMILVRGSDQNAINYINSKLNDSCGVLCFDGEKNLYKTSTVVEYGNPTNPETISKNLFSSLRKFDKTNVKTIYARVIEPKGIGLGIYNRMLRAASFNVVSL